MVCASSVFTRVLPRGVSGDRLVRALERLGYSVIRQKGSHVRMRHEGPPVHVITVPLHNPLKTGTLHAILSEVAQMRSIDIETIIELL
jgi:predicted RNA binding protein YcfA (HicA-like mRNA interferase family)